MSAMPTTMQFTYASTGGLLKSNHVDGGERTGLSDALGRTWFGVDARGFVSTVDYDALHRPLSGAITQLDTGETMTTSRVAYGDGLDSEVAKPLNCLGRPVTHFDQSGWGAVKGYSIHGAGSATEFALTKAYQAPESGMPVINIPGFSANGDKPADAGLQATTYTAAMHHDALGRVDDAVNPNDNAFKTDYLPSGLPDTFTVDKVDYLHDIEYNAKGQVLSMARGNYTDDNGETGDYTTCMRYDARDYRMKQAYTSKSSDFIASLTNSENTLIDGSGDNGRLQDTRYIFDPAGNIAATTDFYPDIVFGQTDPDSARNAYRYDARYRLLDATGLEGPNNNPVDGTPTIGPATHALEFSGFNRLTPYHQQYFYDHGGNVTAMQHASDGVLDDNRSASMKVSQGSNRSIPARYYSSLGGTATETEIPESFLSDNKLFDVHGNQLKNENITEIRWNYLDQISQLTYPDPDDTSATVTEYYVYSGSGGTRTRKISQTRNTDGQITRLGIVTYLGNLELRASYVQPDTDTSIAYDGETVTNGTIEKDYSSLRLRLGHKQTAKMLKGILKKGGDEETKTTYTLSNHLDSCQAELDAAGNISSYQAYYPYGGTAFSAESSSGSDSSLALKDYQYSGQEKDCSGLYYYGFRYYNPTTFRWTKPDPAGLSGSGLNWYAMVSGNPITLRDVMGLDDYKDLMEMAKHAYGSSGNWTSYLMNFQRIYRSMQSDRDSGTNSYKKAVVKGALVATNSMFKKEFKEKKFSIDGNDKIGVIRSGVTMHRDFQSDDLDGHVFFTFQNETGDFGRLEVNFNYNGLDFLSNYDATLKRMITIVQRNKHMIQSFKHLSIGEIGDGQRDTFVFYLRKAFDQEKKTTQNLIKDLSRTVSEIARDVKVPFAYKISTGLHYAAISQSYDSRLQTPFEKNKNVPVSFTQIMTRISYLAYKDTKNNESKLDINDVDHVAIFTKSFNKYLGKFGFAYDEELGTITKKASGNLNDNNTIDEKDHTNPDNASTPPPLSARGTHRPDAHVPASESSDRDDNDNDNDNSDDHSKCCTIL
ncbi:MAG: RHS repeat-associated core domain-containing protein [Gammaproteobacteria bacterium]|nr:RHS repeat-associated core domain-containing protein [Gammaproteobacteria bacterium]